MPPSDQQRSLTPTVNVLDAAHGKYEPPRRNVNSHGGGGGAAGRPTATSALHLQERSSVMDVGLIVFGGKDLKAAAQLG